MINFEALFKVTYGLYIVSSGDKITGNGLISNTVFQVTSEPAKFATCCNKDNHTSKIIDKHGFFSVSVLQQDTDPKIFGNLGYKSGKNINKFENLNIKYDVTGVPIVLNNSIAYLECKIVDKVDVGTHWLFIGELVNAQILDDSLDPLTYAYYRKVKKGIAPKNAPTYIDKSKLENKSNTKQFSKYKCTACGYIYDESNEDAKFVDLPDSWTCPICGVAKEDFIEV